MPSATICRALHACLLLFLPVIPILLGGCAGEGRHANPMAAPAEATVDLVARGEYLVRGGKLETLEGGWTPVRLTLLRFPSYGEAKAWYDGQSYGAARAKRAGCTEYFNMVLVEGA